MFCCMCSACTPRKERLPHGAPQHGRHARPQTAPRCRVPGSPDLTGQSLARRPPISVDPASTSTRHSTLYNTVSIAIFSLFIVNLTFSSCYLSASLCLLPVSLSATSCWLSVLLLYPHWIYISSHLSVCNTAKSTSQEQNMPPRLPPTPAASGELHIKDHAIDAMSEHSFALPPAALSPVATDDSGSSTSRKTSVVFQTPVSPASPDFGGRRMSTASSRAGSKRAAATAALDEFNLPPPPTRARKIIQMKPKPASSSSSAGAAGDSTTTQSAPKSTGKSSTTTNSKPAASAAAASQQPTTANGGSKKKQPSATSAAGRKIARKTAHSLIERRRRSKMNEEFSTLKDMIPACRGQEMHKLAILQVSTLHFFF